MEVMNKNIPQINAVDGFNPGEFARTLENEDGSRSLYLDVKYRLLWFRLHRPDGKISSEIIHVDEKSAVVSCRLYNDKNDPADQFVAMSSAQRFASQDRFGDRYLEIAETAAMGRVLAAAGYGTQFCSFGDMLSGVIADAPVELPGADEEPELPFAASAHNSVQMPAADQLCDQMLRYPQANENAPAGTGRPLTLEDLLNTMTVQEAQQVVVDMGYNKGMTLGQLALHKPRDLEWYVNHYAGKNLRLKAGAVILMNAAMSQAG